MVILSIIPKGFTHTDPVRQFAAIFFPETHTRFGLAPRLGITGFRIQSLSSRNSEYIEFSPGDVYGTTPRAGYQTPSPNRGLSHKSVFAVDTNSWPYIPARSLHPGPLLTFLLMVFHW